MLQHFKPNLFLPNMKRIQGCLQTITIIVCIKKLKEHNWWSLLNKAPKGQETKTIILGYWCFCFHWQLLNGYDKYQRRDKCPA